MPVTVPFEAEGIKIWVKSDFDAPIEISSVAFVKASGTKGAVEGEPVPLLFGEGKAGTQLAQRDSRTATAEATAKLSPGLWYLETHYASVKCSYSYDVDGGFTAAGDSLKSPSAKFRSVKVFVGNAYRIDLFTQSPAPVIVCYGDSITQGSGATPMSGNNYPHLLGQALKRPVVNLGINSDQVIYTAGMPQLIKRINGTKDVIFLMGINDIAWGGQIKNVKDYSSRVVPIIEDAKRNGMKFYLGTITPAGGLKIFDNKPEKEALRSEINQWIRQQKHADGVVDFDEALRDPANPVRLQSDYHCGDFIHPSDLGYQKMAATAVSVLQGKSQ